MQKLVGDSCIIKRFGRVELKCDEMTHKNASVCVCVLCNRQTIPNRAMCLPTAP
jgi:hypothetical protein